MERDAMPSLAEPAHHARLVPEIEPRAVLSMLAVLEAGAAGASAFWRRSFWSA